MSSTEATERSRTPAESLLRFALALSFFAAAAARARFLADPADAAELAFLALAGTIVLIGIGLVERTAPMAAASVALLAQMVLWGLPAGAARGAIFSGLLAVGFAYVTTRHWLSLVSAPDARIVAWAIGAQALFRPEIWLTPALEVATLAPGVAYPAIAALAGRRLAERHGPNVWLGLVAMAAFDRGFGGGGVLALTVLVALAELPKPKRVAIWTVSGLLVMATGVGSPLTLGALLATAVFCHLLLIGRAGVGLTGIAMLALALLLTGARPDPAVTSRFLLLALTALPLAAAPRGGLPRRILPAGIAAAVGGLVLQPGSALAAPLLVVACALPERGLGLRLQARWLGLLATAAAICASYPWLRDPALDSAIAWLGVSAGWTSAIAALALFWLTLALARRWKSGSWAPAVGAAAILIAVTLAHPPQQRLLPDALVLDSNQTARDLEAGMSIRELTIDTYVSNTPEMDPGTELGRIVVRGPGTTKTLTLTLGRETGEWAAARPGFEGKAPAPQPWVSWLAPDGAYFARRYRAEWSFEPALDARSIRIERAATLPPESTLAVWHLGAR